MKSIKLLILVAIAIGASLSASAQKPSPIVTPKQTAAAEKEVRLFFDTYAEDLQKHRREAIAERYDRRGTYFLGNGQKELRPFEAVKERYVNKWKGPKSFEWKDLSFEILSPTVAAVLGRFEWQTADGKTFNYSYTGILTKRGDQWRIRVEDESSAQ